MFSVRKTKEQFIRESIGIHGGKYGYGDVVYVTNKDKVKINCSIHGMFEQRPNDHLSGKGCKKCAAVESNSKFRIGKDEFEKRARVVHGDKYDYSRVKYIANSKPVEILCSIHGVFTATPKNHLKGAVCIKCSYEKARKPCSLFSEFLEKARNTHEEKYKYVEESYKAIKKNLDIVCLSHGVFSQNAKNHINGAGCPICKTEQSGWTKSKYTQMAKKYGGSHLYLIKCFNKNESFYKIGITVKTVKQRYAQDMPYQYEVIGLVHGEGGYVWQQEKNTHRALKDFRYKPCLAFGGMTECFSELIVEVKQFFGVEK